MTRFAAPEPSLEKAGSEETLSEREFWLTVRRGLVMVVRAIERRYRIPSQEKPRRG